MRVVDRGQARVHGLYDSKIHAVFSKSVSSLGEVMRRDERSAKDQGQKGSDVVAYMTVLLCKKTSGRMMQACDKPEVVFKA